MSPLDLLLVVPFAAALLAAVVAAAILNTDLNRTMGAPNWTFSTSWASNITAIGGVLAFAAAIALIKQDDKSRYLTHDQYVVFSVLFPLLAAIAPLVYTCLSRVLSANPGVRIEGRGYTLAFASIFTIWGSIGQLMLQVLLVKDICDIVVIPAPASCVLDVILSLLGIGLLCYASRSIIVTVRPPPAAAAAVAPHRGWSLL